MNNTRTKILGILLIVILSSFYYFVQQCSPQWISNQYQEQNFQLLNHLSASAQNESLDYYLGRIEVNIFGPIKSILSGIFYLICLYLFFRRSRLYLFTLFTFIFLLLTKFEILTFPPYGDALIGPLSGAIWLVRNNMDFMGLLKQPTFIESGPLIYPVSIYPPFLAIMLKITSTPKIFLITMHTLNLFLGSLIVGCTREIGKKFLNQDSANLASTLLLFLPLFSTHLELINMEITSLCFAVISLYFLIHHHIFRASIFAILATLIKIPAAITCAVVFAGSIILLIIHHKERSRWKYILIGLIPILTAFILAVIRSHILGEQVEYNKVSLLIGWPILSQMGLFWGFLLTICIILIHLIINRCSSENWSLFFNNNLSLIIVSMMAVCWFGMYVNISAIIYRYQILLLPFLILCCIACLTKLIKSSEAQQIIVICLITVTLFCSHGYLQKHHLHDNFGMNIFERSLEYRNELKLRMKMASIVENQYADYLISSPISITQLLNFHEVGYVSKKLNTMVFGYGATHKEIKTFTGLKNLDLNKTLWVVFPDRDFKDFPEYPLGPHDKLIQTVQVGNKKIIMFRGGFSIEKMRLLILRQQQKQLEEQNLHPGPTS